jgi:RNA polymerase sigma-70 factor (ECF subfamily)
MISLDAPREKESEEVGRMINLLESDDHGPAREALDEERKRMIRDTLEQLPESMYSVVQLVYFQGLKYREAAEVLDIPVGTVKSRVHSAIARLGEVWNTKQVD